MTTFADMVYMLGGVPLGGDLAEVGLAGGKWYFCDPTHGADANDGLSPDHAKLTLLAAYNLTRDGYNDGVVFLGGATAYNPTALLTWSNNYTHLIGTNGLPGQGNRCRIVAQAASALANVVTFSGSGCLIKNIQISNEKATGSANGIAIVSGSRNIFQNCFFMTPVSTTAAAYSLKVSGSENVFVRCTIGQHTNVRVAATRGLWLFNGTCLRNKFIKCEFLSWSSVTTHVLAYTDIDLIGETFTVQFEDCLWHNYNGSGEAGGILAVAIDDNIPVFHQMIFRGKNEFVACTAVADPLTYALSIYPVLSDGGLMAAISEA
jgi:hypothetical protein